MAEALRGPEEWVPLTLENRKKISPDTFLFRFKLPSPDHILGLPVGQNIQVRSGHKVNGEDVIRAYTPVSSNDDKGFMDLLIKVYFKNVHPNFPDGGVMSQFIHGLRVGTTLDVRGPTGRLLYYGQGKFSTRPDKITDYSQPIAVAKVNMIAGGSGITPMLQIVRAILKDTSDLTSIALLFANKSTDDILCREELEEIRDKWPHRVKLWFTLDSPPSEGWKYGSGFITAEMIKSQLFPPSDNTITLMCGPPPMIQYACNPNLDKLGYPAERRHAY
ncbi:NADH-cytochrome b5 reductase 2 [Folsomia candida]|uniref:NADH-cytochrome b5 reductase n=1 Tax=Folsomia candida TaxID=158441 RepID=A0A226ELE2_FOLCA|nr:NADH-cytochrome b5 reductase 2 [Folsomia candida]OXA58452.1 NADH-cytochrome b5 reductase 2 [Folsomia candida]